jgi:hypothetical protein
MTFNDAKIIEIGHLDFFDRFKRFPLCSLLTIEKGRIRSDPSLRFSRLRKPTVLRLQLQFEKTNHVFDESFALAGFGSRDSRNLFRQTQLLSIGELIDSGDCFTGV